MIPCYNRLSAAVGVACGVGLLRVATTAAFTTIFILRMGRKKKKYLVNNYDIERRQQQERNRLKMIGLDERSPVLQNSSKDYAGGDDDDDHDDFSAEIHVTTHWDEHHDHDLNEVGSENYRRHSEDVPQQHEQTPNEEASNPLIANLNRTIFGDPSNDPSGLMEEIVRSAWQNDNKTVSALVDIVLNRVEQRDGETKLGRTSKEDDSSSSNSNYLP